MKLTIEIPDAYTGDLLKFLAGLTAPAVDLDMPPLPTPTSFLDETGKHPLASDDPFATDLDDGDIRCGIAEPIGPLVDLAMPRKNRSGPDPVMADPLKVTMDDPVEPFTPRLIPEPGKFYRTRNGYRMRCDAAHPDCNIQCELEGVGLYFYDRTGLSITGNRDFDCIEEIPEPLEWQKLPV
jgi:hypothetical protein